MHLLDRLKGRDRFETAENYSIAFVLIGALMLSAGIGLSIVATKGFSAILAMLGAFVSFVATIVLIFIWLVKEFFGE